MLDRGTVEPVAMMRTDAELWAGVADCVESDFGELFQRYNKLVYNFAFRATASWSQAEDLTQATFTALWRRACQGTVDALQNESAAPVLLSMVRQEVANQARASSRRLRLVQKVQQQPTTDPDNVDSWVAQEAGMARVRQVLAQLPKDQQAVIELVAWSGLDMAECAVVLGVPVGTVKSRLSRARKKLASSEIAHLLGNEG